MTDDRILVGGGGENYAEPRELLLRYANRHGLITGATGTGKTVTLQILAEALSAAGVPVVIQDVKGDVSGLSRPGDPAAKAHDALTKRAQQIGFTDFAYRAAPVVFWDLFGQQGHPVRTTVSELGPLLLARMMELSDAQEGVLNIAFRVADEAGPPPPRPRRPPVDPHLARRQRPRHLQHLRQRHHRLGRRHPARPPRPREPGRRAPSSASPPSTSPTSSPPTPRAAAASTSSCPTS